MKISELLDGCVMEVSSRQCVEFGVYTPKQYINCLYEISKMIMQIEEPTFEIAKLMLEDYARFKVFYEHNNDMYSSYNNGDVIRISDTLIAFGLYDSKEGIMIGSRFCPTWEPKGLSRATCYPDILSRAEVDFLDMILGKVRTLEREQDNTEKELKNQEMKKELVNIYKKEEKQSD